MTRWLQKRGSNDASCDRSSDKRERAGAEPDSMMDKGRTGLMRNNKLRALLTAGKPTLGTHMFTPSPAVVEILGHTGIFDYVEFSSEDGTFDLHDLDEFCRAAELYGLGTMIKVEQSNLRFVAGRAVGAGFEAMLFANTRSSEEAHACVQAVRPEMPGSDGEYGVTVRRSSYGMAPASVEYIEALSQVVVALMIEKKEAVERLEDILSVKGIDMVNFGPCDYSMSIGRTGCSDWTADPRMRAVERTVLTTAINMGIAPRVEIDSPDEARYYLDLGVRHLSIGYDLLILRDWWQANGEAVRRAIE